MANTLNSLAAEAVREQLRNNSAAKRVRDSWPQRLVRLVFDHSKFRKWILLYGALDLLLALMEGMLSAYSPSLIPAWSNSALPDHTTDIRTLLFSVHVGFITAQVGALGVISIAIGLVSLIAQSTAASADVQIYYYDSMSLPLVASSVALLSILCIQLVWPLQFAMHLVGLGTGLQIFKILLCLIHVGWLFLNLVALAHFVKTTFIFVQPKTRQVLREHYTAHYLQKLELTELMRGKLFQHADVLSTRGGAQTTGTGCPSVLFGNDNEAINEVVIEKTFRCESKLHNIRFWLLRPVLNHWISKSIAIAEREATQALDGHAPIISFTPRLDSILTEKVMWCRRSGGASINFLERWLIRRSFVFKEIGYED